MRAAFAILMLIVCANCMAQTETTFTVSKKKTVEIECKSDTLQAGKYYYFKVYSAKTIDLIAGKFAGGEVWLNDTAVCIHTKDKLSTAKSYPLELFYKKDMSPAFSKRFNFIVEQQFERLPGRANQGPVYITLWQSPLTDGDSVSKKAMGEGIMLHAYQFSNDNREHKVISFKTAITCNGKTETLSSSNAYLTPLMSGKLDNLQEGCVVVFKDIKYTSTNSSPDDLYAGPYRIFVTE
ncbi:MAG: hypothetical protein KA149_04535 [Chitinophagales bacterium]|nr:hypothetical protein [Chitinophagales bacterium]